MSTQTGNKVTRGERILTKMVNENLISLQGKDWLIAAIDPFHDHQLKELAGWPDVQSGASVVSTVKDTVTIRKPPTAPAGPWTCFIVQWPWLSGNKNASSVGNYAAMSRVGNEMSLNFAAPGNNASVGGLVIYYVPEGLPLDITLGNGTLIIARIDVDQLYTNGITRLIGLGHEVHNTTAMINLQGSVIVWRMMSNENEKTTWVENGTTDGTIAIFSGPLVRYPPSTQGEALLLSGSRQWEAKDGTYSVAAFHNIENPAVLISPSAPVIASANSVDSEGVLANSNVYGPLPAPNPIPGIIRPITGFRVHNFHMHGEIFTGLSDETTLTVNQNAFFEKFPGPDDKEVLPLATLSAEYDPDVLDLYSRIVNDLPVAVPVRENGLGDWFYDAASTAAKYLGPVLSGLPHPMLKGAGMALTGMSEVMQKNEKKQKANKQSVPPPNSWGPAPGVHGPMNRQYGPQNRPQLAARPNRPAQVAKKAKARRKKRANRT